MRRGAKPAKSKVEARPPITRKSRKSEGSGVDDLEKRLAAALDQRTAASEILRVISSSPTDVQPVFDAIVVNASRLCGGEYAIVIRYDGEMMHLAAQHNPRPGAAEPVAQIFPRAATRGSSPGRAILTRSLVHIPDALEDPEYDLDIVRAAGLRGVLSMPMSRDGKSIGAISVSRETPGPFAQSQIELLQTFAEQAVIAIENVRLFKELQEKNRALTESHAQVTEALEQQTATGEILRVISRSQTDVQPVFDSIAESSLRLCGALFSSVYRFDGELVHMVAQHNYPPAALELSQRVFPARPSRQLFSARAILERAVVHIADILADENYAAQELVQSAGFRSALAVPMMRGAEPIGAIGVWHADVGPFTDKHIALLKTFADQAVIAIENVRLFRELEAANRQLEASSRHKSEFLANMSHELRTPLNAIIGFSEVLIQRMFGELNAKQDEYLKDVYASGQHLLSLINDILDLSKIEAGRMELSPAPFHLPSAVENAVTLVKERAARHGIALQVDLDPQLGEIVGDERKVKQVLLNLLSNAVKFTPEGGRISLRASRQDRAVEIAVTDTGIGIAPEDQAAIFEEFRQVGSDETRKQEGTGLGLTLAKKFIELHEGRIWVESTLGIGSTFTFTLPES